MLDSRIVTKLEELFKEEPFNIGEININISGSWGRIKVTDIEDEES